MLSPSTFEPAPRTFPDIDNLTRQEKIDECLKVLDEDTGFLYFLENYCWIEGKKKGEKSRPIRFIPWPGQIVAIEKLLVEQLIIILKARQLGLTWLVAAYCLWCAIKNPMVLIIVISAKEDWAVELVDRIRFIINFMPPFLLPRVSKDIGQHIRFSHPGDLLTDIKSLATTMEGAQGKTPDILIMDETSRNRYAAKIFDSSWPGIEKAGGKLIAISNSHKDGTGWGWTKSTYVGSMKGLNDFTRIFLPWWACPDRLTPYEAYMLKRDPNYKPSEFKALQLRAGMTERGFSENYPESEAEAVSVALGSYFGESLTRHNRITDGVRGMLTYDYTKAMVNGVPTLIPDVGTIGFHDTGSSVGNILEIWRFPFYLLKSYDGLPWTERYCIGSDISEGLGRSFSVAYVYDRLLHEFVARLRSSEVDASLWGVLLYVLSWWYKSSGPEWGDDWNPALICPEVTGAGQTSVKVLRDLNAYMYKRLTSPQETNDMTHKYGWSETNQAKHDLSETLKYYFTTTDGNVYCAILLDECGSWTLKEDGRIGPESDTCFGDCVIAAGLAIEADVYLGPSPKQVVKPEPVTWQERAGLVESKNSKNKSPWVM